MNQDGEFYCEVHKPEKAAGQWWVSVEVPSMECDHCKERAVHYVLQEEKA